MVRSVKLIEWDGKSADFTLVPNGRDAKGKVVELKCEEGIDGECGLGLCACSILQLPDL